MSYFDNVDWEKLFEQGMIRSLEKAIQLFAQDKIKEDEVLPMAKLLFRDCCDEIWLMGPVPMKEGYKPFIMEWP